MINTWKIAFFTSDIYISKIWLQGQRNSIKYKGYGTHLAHGCVCDSDSNPGIIYSTPVHQVRASEHRTVWSWARTQGWSLWALPGEASKQKKIFFSSFFAFGPLSVILTAYSLLCLEITTSDTWRTRWNAREWICVALCTTSKHPIQIFFNQ